MDYKIIDTIPTDTIVLTFINLKYIPIFDVFYQHFKQHNLNNLFVICLDKESREHVDSFGVHTMLIHYNIVDLCEFWRFRLTVINNIFKYSEKNIIHTDVDCFWLKNIIPIFSELSSYDLVGHVAFGHPIQIVDKIGFVMCCGLYFLRYSRKTMNLLDRILAQRLNFVDDQVYFNHYIYENHVKIQDGNCEYLYKSVDLKDKICVGILKNSIVSRDYQDGLFCFHPFLPSDEIGEKLVLIENP
jgi:Nucleotide-diphospho-sugar transferase